MCVQHKMPNSDGFFLKKTHFEKKNLLFVRFSNKTVLFCQVRNYNLSVSETSVLQQVRLTEDTF